MAESKEKFMSITISPEDIYYELKNLGKTVDGHTDMLSGILEQTKKTNGRVTILETCVTELRTKNIVMWVKQNKWLLFIIVILVLITFGESALDTIKALIKFIGSIT